MFSRKGVMLILDGLGDRPVPVLSGRTPLEAAHTPMMDRLAASGMLGLVTHIAPGVPVGTQTGGGLLLGLASSDIGKLSRGLVQAVGAGISLLPGDIALRGNFATLRWGSDRVEIVDRRAGRISDQTNVLADAVNGLLIEDGVEFMVKASTQHRVSLVLRGENLSDAISNTDPGSGEESRGLLLARPLLADDSAACKTARLINAFVERSYAILNDHPVNRARTEQGLPPANGIITRGAGGFGSLRNFLHHQGIATAVVSGEGTLHGLGRLFGFDVIFRPEFTAASETDLKSKVAATIEALADHDLVVLHVKAPDVCAHDCDPERKKSVIEAVDAAIEPLLEMDLVIGVTADHSTDSTTGRHTGDPVPSLISCRHMRRDGLSSFGETECLGGGLGLISPMGFLCTMLDQMNRMQNIHPREHTFFL